MGGKPAAGVFEIGTPEKRYRMHGADQELVSRMLNEHGARLVLYAQQWCGDPEDVVQEAFIRLVRQRPVPENVVGWLYRVVRNGAISQSRSEVRRLKHEASAGSSREAWFKPSNDEAIDGAAAVIALEALPVNEREVIVLRLWSGMSFEEISELVGKSTSTVHRWYETGLEDLRKNWSESCADPKTQAN